MNNYNRSKSSSSTNSNTYGHEGSSRGNADNRMRSLTHHPDYFLIGGDLYIMIETTIFRIHSYWFRREARNFYSKLLDPTSPGESPQGTTESTALIVDNCSMREFELLLWVFYNPKYDIYQAETRDWFSILRLASIWDFPQVKSFALREIRKREDEIPLVERIVLYHTYKAPPEYLVPLYAQLCARPEPPNDQEMDQLGQSIGWSEAVKVFRARETVRAQTWSPTDTARASPLSPLPDGKTERDTYPAISKIMGLPEYRPENDADSDVVKLDPHPVKNTSGRTSDQDKAKKEKEAEKKKNGRGGSGHPKADN